MFMALPDDLPRARDRAVAALRLAVQRCRGHAPRLVRLLAARPHQRRADVQPGGEDRCRVHALHLRNVPRGVRRHGSVINQGFLNTRNRNGLDGGSTPSTPARANRAPGPIWDTDDRVAKGERIGVAVLSSNALWALPEDHSRAQNTLLLNAQARPAPVRSAPAKLTSVESAQLPSFIHCQGLAAGAGAEPPVGAAGALG